MRREALEKLLQEVRRGKTSVGEALEKLKGFPYESLGFARLDHHRTLRQGIPEVIYCEGKTKEQITRIVRRMAASGVDILATRANPEIYQAVRRAHPGARYHPQARVIVIRSKRPPERDKPAGHILILTAGTADIPVAEEARVTAELLGSHTTALYDVGVAGLHRLMDQKEVIEEAKVLVVVAGMDGVLPSVVGGLAGQPIVAVPTSQGYGTGLGGFTALLTMLNSCAAGVGVVNIDNGFGAACLAHRINTLSK